MGNLPGIFAVKESSTVRRNMWKTVAPVKGNAAAPIAVIPSTRLTTDPMPSFSAVRPAGESCRPNMVWSESFQCHQPARPADVKTSLKPADSARLRGLRSFIEQTWEQDYADGKE